MAFSVPILKLAQLRCPWLTDADLTTDPKLEMIKIKQMYLLQKQTGLTDAKVEDEAEYNTRQLLLLGELVAYDLTTAKASAITAAASTSAGRPVKRTKADVVEVEFESGTQKSSYSLAIDLAGLLTVIQEAACGLARELGYSLALCGALDEYEYAPPGPIFVAGYRGSPLSVFGDGPPPGCSLFGWGSTDLKII